MKKLEDFKAKKIELKTIYGGKMRAGTTFQCGTCTLSTGCEDGPDTEQDI